MPQVPRGRRRQRFVYRADSGFAPSQWDTTLLCTDCPGASLESALVHIMIAGAPFIDMD